MDQADVIRFLSSPAAFGGRPVDVVATHCAMVFLSGDEALKLKRAVHYDYVDQSTIEQRHRLLQRELDLNKLSVPTLYRDLVPITRGEGGLRLGGIGPPVDWVLRMRRFPKADQLDQVTARGEFTDRLAAATGAAIAAYHAAAPVIRRSGDRLIDDILAELGRVFAGLSGAVDAEKEQAARWLVAAQTELSSRRAFLDVRGQGGHVRRGHGDLHLSNIVLLDGRPALYDALEFSEELGTCDVLYDLAFLLMDLGHSGDWRAACRVLDAWLRSLRGKEDSGLAALPLFLSVRAAIRAMVLLQTDAAQGHAGASSEEAGALLALAGRALEPPPARLIAIGGYSASGKSLLASGLAPEVGALPGAVWLSSDLERKAGHAEEERLPEADYAPARRAAVYQQLFTRAGALLSAGQTVLLDATFLDPVLRAGAEAVAERAGVPFAGLWLEAPADVLLARAELRAPGASDANASVVRHQLHEPTGTIAWRRIDAAGCPQTVLGQARSGLGLGTN